MPYTRKQVKLMMSKGSPLSGEQQDKMRDELHANPAMGHMRKGSAAMKRGGPALSPAAAGRIRTKANAAMGK